MGSSLKISRLKKSPTATLTAIILTKNFSLKKVLKKCRIFICPTLLSLQLLCVLTLENSKVYENKNPASQKKYPIKIDKLCSLNEVTKTKSAVRIIALNFWIGVFQSFGKTPLLNFHFLEAGILNLISH